MKTIVLLLTFLRVVWSRPQNNPVQATITKFNTINEVGGYFFHYETSDGQSKRERAKIKNPGTDQESIAVAGDYSYLGEDGLKYLVYYTTNENGFRPVGPYIPLAADVQPTDCYLVIKIHSQIVKRISCDTTKSLVGGGLG